jgi:hypothetical protein
LNFERLNVREGDFIETTDKVIFAVKGLIHPPNFAISILRYYQDESGEREREGKKYKKVESLEEATELLKSKFLSYLRYDKVFGRDLCEVHTNCIIKHYNPKERLYELSKNYPNLINLEAKALEFCEILSEQSSVSLNKFGISGSILTRLIGKGSDIDLIVYGKNECRKVRGTLERLLSKNLKGFQRYGCNKLKKLYNQRLIDTLMDFETFLFHEKRKSLQGVFKGTDFYIRCIKDWNEINERYGDCYFKPIGKAKIKARIIDDSESYLTPCKYIIGNVKILEGKDVKIKELISFRGRFCEQVRNNEIIFAKGIIEKVIRKNEEYYRLVVGEDKRDILITFRV